MLVYADKYLKDKSLASTPLTLVNGDDSYLMSRVVKRAESLCDAKATEFVKLYGDETEAQEFFSALESISFFSSDKFVLLNYFNKINSKSDRDKILQYLAQGVPTNVSVVITADKFDKRDKNCAKLCKEHLEVSCKKPYNSGEVIKYLKATGLKFTDEALQLFARSVELDYAQISKECEKLFLLFGKEETITAEAIGKYLLGSREHSVFELQNCLGDRKCGRALLFLEQILENGASGVMIVGVLFRFFNILFKVVALRDKYNDSEILANHLGEVHAYFRKDYLAYGRKYSKKEILQIFLLLQKADRLLKSSAINQRVVLRNIVVKICRRIR